MNIKTSIKENMSFFFMAPALIWQCFFFVLPMLIVVLLATMYHGSFSLIHYTSIMTIQHISVIGRSLATALITAMLCLFIGYPLTYFLTIFLKNKGRLPFFIFMLPFGVNFLVQIYAWLSILQSDGMINVLLSKIGIIKNTIPFDTYTAAIIVVMVYCYLPFMMLALHATLSKLDLELLEAAADLGSTPWQTFVRVTLPLSLDGVKTGFLLVMVPVFGEFAIPSLIGGGRYLFIGSLISHYFLVVRDPGLGAALTIVSGIVLFAAAYTVILFFNRVGGYYRSTLYEG